MKSKSAVKDLQEFKSSTDVLQELKDSTMNFQLSETTRRTTHLQSRKENATTIPRMHKKHQKSSGPTLRLKTEFTTVKINTDPIEMECTTNDECFKRFREATCRKKSGSNSTLTYCICVHTSELPGPDMKCRLKVASGTPKPIHVNTPQNLFTSKTVTYSPSTGISIFDITLPTTTEPTSRVNFPTQLLTPISIASFVLTLVAVLTFLIWKICHRTTPRKRKNSKVPANVIAVLPQNFIQHQEKYANNPQYTQVAANGATPITVPTLLRSTITNLQEIGEGFFGKVYKGQFHIMENDAERVETVAIKMLKSKTNRQAEEDFMKELEIMSAFRHDNILSLIGFCPKDQENGPWMVFEYMPYGDLVTVLRNNSRHFWLNRPDLPRLTPQSLLSIGQQIAEGMQYLVSQRFVHRDLACRNCLVGSDLAVKIADFGMSRDVYICDYYRVGSARMLPVRWMSPESISIGKFTLESDIWSYGVVLWEIFSFGKQPYYGHTNEEVLKFIIQGKLLEKPEDCPFEVAEIMFACWKIDPKERIPFTGISERLASLKANEDRQGTPCLPRPPELPVSIELPPDSFSSVQTYL